MKKEEKENDRNYAVFSVISRIYLPISSSVNSNSLIRAFNTLGTNIYNLTAH